MSKPVCLSQVVQPKPAQLPGYRYAVYKGEELKRVAARPGAMDAYKIPSRGLKC